jgi:hypothetical protein
LALVWVAADIVMKSRSHHGSKYRAGVPVIAGRSSVPFEPDAIPLGVEGL